MNHKELVLLSDNSKKIVVVGATGNLGLAVLRQLQGEAAKGRVADIVGVSRRAPDASSEPYRGTSWNEIDIASATAEDALARVFAGADAVIHLAWALQPNRDERAMWRTNVSGTARILRAAVTAGVPQVLVASSVGAYSAGPKHRRVNENWPTGGVPTSHYSRHKAVNERAYDAFEQDHPEIVLTRMRPGLVFQREAASEMVGLFLGSLIPVGWLGVVRPPVLPLPSQTIFQAVHARDVAEAFWLAIDRRAGGAFNLAAEPVLDPPTIARAIGARRWVPVRGVVARALVWATWKLRVQSTDPGWIDIALQVPVMSTERARTVLGWQPSVSAPDALAEVVAGVGDHDRKPGSPPLRGRTARH